MTKKLKVFITIVDEFSEIKPIANLEFTSSDAKGKDEIINNLKSLAAKYIMEESLNELESQ